MTDLQRENPSVQRVTETLKDQDVVILPISIDGSGEKASSHTWRSRLYL